jgi:3-methyladenine DNA glycosylase AlkD
MVVKALAWALRELAKRDPTVVRQFIEELTHNERRPNE